MKKIIIFIILIHAVLSPALLPPVSAQLRYDPADRELFEAAAFGRLDTLSVWISMGKSVNITDKYNNTPLLIASEDGQLEFVKQLLATGAEVDAANKYGYTPMLAALVNGHYAVAVELENAGASTFAENVYGTSVNDYFALVNARNVYEYSILADDTVFRIGPNSKQYLKSWEKEMLLAEFSGNSQMVASAMENLTVFAQEGDPVAAEIYGLTAGEDGERYLMYAAENGMPVSMLLMGKKMLAERQYSKAEQFLCSAADLGEMRAATGCGAATLYASRDYYIAYAYLKKGWDNGDYEALYYLGLMKYYGWGVERDVIQALADIQNSAQNGVADAGKQLAIFATEDILNFLTKYHKVLRSAMRTYMISQGARMGTEKECDIYDVQACFAPQFGIKTVSICYPESGPVMKFSLTGTKQDKYGQYVSEYAEKNKVILDR